MGVATQLTDFSDLYTDLQNRIRLQTAVTATENQAKRYINIALFDIHIGFGEKFPWCERRAQLVTQAEYTTGTLDVSQGSTTLTGTSTAWNTANAFGNTNMQVGGKIVIDGGAEVYEISAVASDTSATLTSAYVASDASTASYVYFEDEYALASDFLRPLDLQSFDSNAEIELVGRNEFRMRYPRNKITGRPTVATIIDLPFSGDTTPVRKVRLHKPPDEAYLIPYSYVKSNLAVSAAGAEQQQLVEDTDEPIVPLPYRHVIVYHALKNWYRDKRDDARSQEVAAEYNDLMIRITGDTEFGRARPQIRPRRSPYLERARRPYRGRGARRYSADARFDELRD